MSATGSPVKAHPIFVTSQGHDAPGSPKPLFKAVPVMEDEHQLMEPVPTSHVTAEEGSRQAKQIAELQDELARARFDLAKGAALLRQAHFRNSLRSCRMPHNDLACREKEAALMVQQKARQEDSFASRMEHRSLAGLQRQLQVGGGAPPHMGLWVAIPVTPSTCATWTYAHSLGFGAALLP